MTTPPSPTVEPASGRLGVLTVGLGAVASTLIAGVELSKRGLGSPIGSLTQMGTIRLGKRTEDRSPLIKDFVPLATLDDLVWERGTFSRTTPTCRPAAPGCSRAASTSSPSATPYARFAPCRPPSSASTPATSTAST